MQAPTNKIVHMNNIIDYIPKNKRVFILPFFAKSVKNTKSIGYKNGKPFIRYNKSQREYLDKAKVLFKKQRIERDNYSPPIPATLHILYGFRKNIRRDYPNITQGILDALVDAGVIKDDSYKYIIPVYYKPYIGLDFVFLSFEYFEFNDFVEFIIKLKKYKNDRANKTKQTRRSKRV